LPTLLPTPVADHGLVLAAIGQPTELDHGLVAADLVLHYSPIADRGFVLAAGGQPADHRLIAADCLTLLPNR
jgi:hypothetical protein